MNATRSFDSKKKSSQPTSRLSRREWPNCDDCGQKTLCPRALKAVLEGYTTSLLVKRHAFGKTTNFKEPFDSILLLLLCDPYVTSAFQLSTSVTGALVHRGER